MRERNAMQISKAIINPIVFDPHKCIRKSKNKLSPQLQIIKNKKNVSK